MVRYLRFIGLTCLLVGLIGNNVDSSPLQRYHMGGAIQGRPFSPNGVVTTLAGAMRRTSGSADGTGATARFAYPVGITTDGANLYIVDNFSNAIRKVVIATGVVTTMAGTPFTAGHSDGTGAAVSFNSPAGITTDGTHLYVADQGNVTIRKIVIASGVVTTMAGAARNIGDADGIGAAARFIAPTGITTDGKSLFVTDSISNTIRQIVIATGLVTTLAGNALNSGHADGTGASARFNNPVGITTDGTNLFVDDRDNNAIRKIEIATGAVTTLIGGASPGGPAGKTDIAAFNSPTGITTDGANLYVSDTGNNTIRKIVIASGAVSTLAGSPPPAHATSADGSGAAARFFSPAGITTDGTNLYVADLLSNTIRKIQ